MIQRILRFLTHDLWVFISHGLWVEDIRTLEWTRRLMLRSARVAVLVGERVMEGRYSLRASALTYSTLLSLIPFLAVAFSVAKSFGAQEALYPILRTYLAAGQGEIIDNIVLYVNRTDVKALGTVGLIFVLVTVVMVIGNAEDAFNDIFGIQRARPWSRKFADYVSVTIIFPILLLAASGLTATLSSARLTEGIFGTLHVRDFVLTLLQAARFMAIWFAFAFLYVFLPNTRVRPGPAAVGGVAAGSAWLLAQWGYVHFQVGVSRYNAIYGTFAALPIFLVWLYVSWFIVLLGAELVHAVHVVHGESRERRAGPLSARDRKRLALRLAIIEAERLDAGRLPLGETHLIEELGGLSARQVRAVLDTLDKSGIFQALERADGEFTHILRQSPDRLRLIAILEAFEREGRCEQPLAASVVDEFLELFEKQLREHPLNMTLRELKDTVSPALLFGPDGKRLGTPPVPEEVG
jgi:membrane protein